MKNAFSFTFLSVLLLVGCGKQSSTPLIGQPGTPEPEEDQIVVRSRATLDVSVGAQAVVAGANRLANGSVPVTVINGPNTTMAIDSSAFIAPTINNNVLDFGNLTVASLLDNNLKVCGAGGNQKCGTALIRIYTTGVAGAGLWNSVDGYGAPMTASLTSAIAVGLGAANAAVMHSLSIPSNKHVLRHGDFSGTPSYDINFDFTDAGAGSFSTTVVIEYALAP